MDVINEVENRLAKAFSPSNLEVINESHLHEGHGGHRPGIVTHVRIRISSDAFAGKTRLQQHRAINTELDGLMNNPIHALAIEAKSS